MSLLISHFYRFGAFSLDAQQRVLLRDGKPLPLAPKIFDTLLVLVECSGRIVGKDELMRRLWPDTFVEEANLTFNIQQIRKTLGDSARKPVYIETIARRGYRFIANVERESVDEDPTLTQTSDALVIPECNSGAEEAQASELLAAAEPAPNRTKQDDRAVPAEILRVGSRRSLATTLSVIIGLAAIASVVWFSLGRNLSKGGDRQGPGIPPLKLEKLTQTGQSRQTAISPDGKYIAYTRSLEGKAGIWLRQLATNTNIEIVPPTNLLYSLAFANGGDSLYFVRGDPTELCRISLLGGSPTKIADKLEGHFSLSSDDEHIAFTRRSTLDDGQRRYSLIIASSNGDNERVLLEQMYPNSLDVAVWSPNNKSIICTYGNSEAGSRTMGILEVSVADGTKHELSIDPFFNIGKMQWLPNKEALIMTARKDPQDNKELWQLSYPGMEIKQLTDGLSPFLDLSIAQHTNRVVASQATRISDLWVGASPDPGNLRKITQAIDAFCWTTNGRLVYQSTASGNRDLWITQPNGEEQRQLTNDSAVDQNPAVTPDNRYVVFASNRSGILQIWRMNVDGSNQIQLTHGAAKDYPAVSPDGRWVLFNTTDDWHLWKVSIDGGEEVPLTEYPAYFPSASPDGRFIACVARNEARRAHSILILPFDGVAPSKRLECNTAGFSKVRIQWTRDGKALIYALEKIGSTALVRQPLDGSAAQTIMDFKGDQLFDFGYSPDGLFAITRGEWQHDIVLINDLGR